MSAQAEDLVEMWLEQRGHEAIAICRLLFKFWVSFSRLSLQRHLSPVFCYSQQPLVCHITELGGGAQVVLAAGFCNLLQLRCPLEVAGQLSLGH